jgi:methylase of polypeptide subunit release factors
MPGTRSPAIPSRAPDVGVVSAALEAAGVAVLVLRGSVRSEDGASGSDASEASASADRTIQILVPSAHRKAARRVLEPLSWRYSWVHGGLLRLTPMIDYWWDGGREIELYWGGAAAPLPAVALSRLTRALWRSAARGPDGLLRPDVETLVVHVAVQACRRGRVHQDDWAKFLELRPSVTDWSRAQAIARAAGVSPAVRRAVAAADTGSERPGAGPVYDGLLDTVWRLALAVQARARPRRFKRLLAGTPSFGDTTIRCRVGMVEVLAGPGVFVPSSDADLFVEEAGNAMSSLDAPTVVEVGTGCGAIALALARTRPDAIVHAADLSSSAVRWARRNARRLDLGWVSFHRGSLLDPLPPEIRGRVDLIIANLPYFPAREYASIGSIPRGTIQGGGDDGLDLVRRLVRDAIPCLRPGGGLLLQMFAWQWEAFGAELVALGYRPGTPRASGAFVIGPAHLVPTRRRPAPSPGGSGLGRVRPRGTS